MNDVGNQIKSNFICNYVADLTVYDRWENVELSFPHMPYKATCHSHSHSYSREISIAIPILMGFSRDPCEFLIEAHL